MNSVREHLQNPLPLTLGGALAGGLIGRGIAPLLSRNSLAQAMGVRPGRVSGATTTLGALLGSVPGLALALARKKLRGSYLAGFGAPRNFTESLTDMGYLSHSLPSALPAATVPSMPRQTFSISKTSADAGTYSRELWDPAFAVRPAIEEIRTNPYIPPTQRAQMTMVVARSGKDQGGSGALGSAGSLLQALPRILPQTIPTVGGAYLAASALGMSPKAKHTLTGAALVASTLRNFLKGGADYSYCSTQVNLPDDLAKKVQQLAERIHADDVVELEDDPHITVLYGLHEHDPEAVQDALKQQRSAKIKLGKTQIFAADEKEVSHGSKDAADVLYIAVDSSDLSKWNARLRNLLTYTNDYPTYSPHVTIAYLKAGTGKKYTGWDDLEGETFTANALQCCDTDGTQVAVDL